MGSRTSAVLHNTRRVTLQTAIMVSAALVGLAIKRGRGLYHAPKQWYRLASTTSKSDRIGPDRILPANSLSTTWPDGTVEIRFSDKHPLCQEKPISVWTMLNNTAARCPDNIALAVKRNDEWVNWTYTQYLDEVITVAKAFIKLGLKPQHSVNILGFNAPEWHISAVATVIAGGLTAGIYTTNSIDATRYVAEHSRANIMVVEDEEQYAKIEAIWERLPELQHVVQYTGKGTKLGSVGKCYDTWDVDILDPDEKGLGEIGTRGRNCCMGYLWEEGKTAELINGQGYVLSGDLARYDEDKFLFIGGRQKEIIVTGGG